MDSESSSQSPSTDPSNVLDILKNGEKVGESYDSNPVIIDNDSECLECLNTLKKTLKLDADDLSLIDKCISVVTSKEGEDILFGPGEIIALSNLAAKFPDKATQLMACSHHLSESIEFEGELPPNIYLKTANAFGSLSTLLSAALTCGPITSNNKDFDDDDEDEDENDSDDEDTDDEIDSRELIEAIQKLDIDANQTIKQEIEQLQTKND